MVSCTDTAKRPTRTDLIAAAADVFDYQKEQAERDLIASDWFICQRVRGWLKNHGYAA